MAGLPGGLIAATGLNSLAQGLSSGYGGAEASIFNRRLAQQKQSADSALKGAQADYYGGRNDAVQNVAQTRAAALQRVAGIKAGTAEAALRDKALQALPGDLGKLYYQSPEMVDEYTRSYDQQHGTNFNVALGFGGGQGTLPLMPPAMGGGGFPGGSGSLAPSSADVSGVPSAGSAGFSMPNRNTPGGLPALPPKQLNSSPLNSSPLTAPPVTAQFGAPVPPMLPQIGGASPALPPSAGGMPPALPPPMNSPVAMNSPMVNPLREPPAVTAGINYKNAMTAATGDKSQAAFLNMMGTLAPHLRPAAAAQFNHQNGTSYPMPGMPVMPTTPGGLPALGPPSLTADPYAPNAIQGSVIGRNNSQAKLDGTLAQSSASGAQTKAYTAKQQAQFQERTLQLKARGLTDQEAQAEAHLDIQRGMLAVAQSRAQNDGVGGGGGGRSGGGNVAGMSLHARMMQRLTQMTTPGKPDLFGKPTSPTVTLDHQGNPSGPGAHEYNQLRNQIGTMEGRGGNPPMGLAPVIPGRTPGYFYGSGVPRGTVTPPAPLGPAPPVPNLPARTGGGQTTGMLTIGGRTATRAQWAAELTRRRGR